MATLAEIQKKLGNAPTQPTKLATEYMINRTPFIMTTDEWLADQKYLVWSHNPNQVTWTIKERATNEKTKSGTITHYWWDRNRQTFFDEIVIELQLQTGNIMPIKWDATQAAPTLPEGLNDFYTFWDLINSRKILADGQTNFRYILYNSPVFPRMTLKGKFDPEAGYPFSESAESPHAISDWRCTFIVQDMTPRIGSGGIEFLKNVFESEGFRYKKSSEIRQTENIKEQLPVVLGTRIKPDLAIASVSQLTYQKTIR
jgi:hypothetical protein